MDATDITSKTIYSTLKEEILNLTIPPGQQISENGICERFGVSRTLVRAAFHRLKDAGLLTVIPYKRTFASLLDLEQIEQSIYMRIAIESMMVRDLMPDYNEQIFEKIKAVVRSQGALLTAGNVEPQEFYALDSAMHSIWFIHLHKEPLWKIIKRMQVHYTRFRMLDIVAVQNFQEIYEEHLELLQIIARQDQAQVEPWMRHHLYGGIKRLGPRLYTEFSHYFTK